jgi:starvation-inducible DNA-binding protein
MTLSNAFSEKVFSEEDSLVPREELVVENTAPPVQKLIQELVTLCSVLDKLYTQSHLIHINVEGPLFFPLHEFFKEQYEKHVEYFDKLAETIRSMDYLLPMCEKGLSEKCEGFQHVKSYDAREMCITYNTNLTNAAMTTKYIVKTSQEIEAPDVENLLADIAHFLFKSSWMLKATLRS